MKTFSFLVPILFLFVASGSSQELTKIYSKDNRESYQVLLSDQTIRHGEYERRRFTGDIQVTGYYNNGQKDSLWQFFNDAGIVKQSYDYRNQRLIVYDSSDMPRDFTYQVLTSADTSYDRPPVYIGGREVMYNDFMKGFRYPGKAIDKGIDGKVYISFDVKKDGTTSNFQVVKGIGYGCDEAALNAVKKGAQGWLPGIYKGNEIDMRVTVYISYRIEH